MDLIFCLKNDVRGKVCCFCKKKFEKNERIYKVKIFEYGKLAKKEYRSNFCVRCLDRYHKNVKKLAEINKSGTRKYRIELRGPERLKS